MDSVINRDLGCLTTTVPASEPGGGSLVGEPEGSTLTEKERGCNAKAFREEELLRLTTPELAAVR